MGLNIGTIKQASVKSKNVATEEYVDTGIANIDVSSSVNSGISINNDVVEA